MRLRSLVSVLAACVALGLSAQAKYGPNCKKVG